MSRNRVASDDGTDPLDDEETAYCHPYDGDDNALPCAGPMTQSECQRHSQYYGASYYRLNTRSC